MDDLKAKYLGQIAEATDENALEAVRLDSRCDPVGVGHRTKGVGQRIGVD